MTTPSGPPQPINLNAQTSANRLDKALAALKGYLMPWREKASTPDTGAGMIKTTPFRPGSVENVEPYARLLTGLVIPQDAEVVLQRVGDKPVGIGVLQRTAQQAEYAGIKLTGPTVSDPVGPSGAPLLIDLARPRRLMEFYADAGATTFSTVGMPAPTVASPGTRGTTATGDGHFVGLNTNPTSGQVGSVATAFTFVQARWNPTLHVRLLSWSNAANVRYWVGFFSANPSASGSPSGHVCAFRFDTGVGDSVWRQVLRDGSANTVQAGSAPAFAASTFYDLVIELTPTVARFYVNGSLVNSLSTNIPGSAQDLGVYVGVTALEAVSKHARISRLAISHA